MFNNNNVLRVLRIPGGLDIAEFEYAKNNLFMVKDNSFMVNPRVKYNLFMVKDNSFMVSITYLWYS